MTQLGLPETFSRETKGVPHWNRCSEHNRAVLSARKQSETADLGNDSRMQFYRLQIWITNGRGPQIALIPCRNLQGKFLRKNTKRTPLTTRSQINTPVFLTWLKPSKRETVHGLSQRGYYRQFINQRMKIYISFLSCTDYPNNDPPCALNRTHGPIGCQATDQVSVIPR